MNYTHLLILLLLLIVTIFVFRRDKAQYERFKLLEHTEDRQAFFKRWTVEPFLLYGLLSIVILWLIGREGALHAMPEFLADFTESIQSIGGIQDSNFLSGILKGLAISLVPMLLLGSVMGTFFQEQQRYKNSRSVADKASAEPDFRNLDALIPRNYGERIWGAILSINAGFSEELFFRLLIRILLYSISGSVLFAIMGSTIWFGLGHYYQGISGVLITFFVGLLLFMAYLITQNIWITMLIHAILDLNGLVFGPWLKEWLARRQH